MRGLLLRQTQTSLTSTGLVTYRERVLDPLDRVTFYGGSAAQPPQYRYPNGSCLMLGGLDKPTKVMSSEYDLIYIQEATEVAEAAWEQCTTRLRNGVMPYQQLLADCNPSAPSHWLKQRANRGATLLLESRHEDNPLLWDVARGVWTAVGAAYIAILNALSGVRKLRLRFGIWAAAEGLVFDGWDPSIHLIDSFPIPVEWPRYWVIDFGWTNPFVWSAWAVDPDGRSYRYREIYRTQRLVEDHARDILALTADEPRPRAIVCDHDAEGRATLSKHLGMATIPARKAISPGLQAVSARLRVAGDGRPRLFFLRDALVERDPALLDRKLPTCSEEEIEGYIWDLSNGRRKGETPVDLHNHGMDNLRYIASHLDLRGEAQSVKSPW